MINVRTIRKMVDGDTLNIKNGKIKRYKGGYQVDTCPIDWDTPEKALDIIKHYDGYLHMSFSIRFKDGKYYVSPTEHAYTKPQAKELAKKYNRSITYEWKNLAHMAI